MQLSNHVMFRETLFSITFDLNVLNVERTMLQNKSFFEKKVCGKVTSLKLPVEMVTSKKDFCILEQIGQKIFLFLLTLSGQKTQNSFSNTCRHTWSYQTNDSLYDSYTQRTDHLRAFIPNSPPLFINVRFKANEWWTET